MNKRAFSLMELMIVIVIVGVLATFAIPNYAKSVEKSYERDVYTQLMAIQAANKIYLAQNGRYVTPAEGIGGLNINVIPNSASAYTYVSSSGSGSSAVFRVKAQITNGGYSCRIDVTQDSITKTSSPPNPCVCSGSNCASAVALIPTCTAACP